MALPSWLAYADVHDPPLRGAIESLLKESGVQTHPWPTAFRCSLGLIVFESVNENLLSLVGQTQAHSSVLALCVSSKSLSHQDLWKLIEAGAHDVLQWPRLPRTAEEVVNRLERWQALESMLSTPRIANSLVGKSLAWRGVLRSVVEAAAFSSASILVRGESGTGKEQIARLIHDLDPRPDKGDFVVVDCSTLSPELAGSEFFGHDRGAFTGAVGAREGAFSLAHRGTLFLDEVGELSPELQARLLRVVQEHQFKRIGSNTWQHTDFRLVSATHRDLERGIADGSFRADFYYRIAGWPCCTLPLSERREDILPLADHFVQQCLPGCEAVILDPAVREFLLTRDYPGNVRDLRQLVARICQRHPGQGPITIGDIAPADRGIAHGLDNAWPDSSFLAAVRVAIELGISMKDIGQRATELAIDMALEREGGNLQRAAARLGVTDRALQIRRASQRSSV